MGDAIEDPWVERDILSVLASSRSITIPELWVAVGRPRRPLKPVLRCMMRRGLVVRVRNEQMGVTFWSRPDVGEVVP